MTNPFLNGQFQAEAAAAAPVPPALAAGRKLISDAGLKVGDLATIAWRYNTEYGLENDSVLGRVVEITDKMITVDDKGVAIPLLHSVRKERGMNEKEKAEHELIVAIVEADPEGQAVFDEWDETEAEFNERMMDEQETVQSSAPQDPNPFAGL